MRRGKYKIAHTIRVDTINRFLIIKATDRLEYKGPKIRILREILI